jgi:hypothetical protein
MKSFYICSISYAIATVPIAVVAEVTAQPKPIYCTPTGLLLWMILLTGLLLRMTLLIVGLNSGAIVAAIAGTALSGSEGGRLQR